MANRGYQASFNGGVISPNLFMRQDIEKYRSGCAVLKNMMIMPQGGASKRPGLRFIYEIGQDARLIPFVFNETQAYVLIFTEKKLYVAYDNGLVEDTSGNPVVFNTPYSLAQAKTMTYAQCADVMYLAHGEVRPYKLSRYAHDNWGLTLVDFTPLHPPVNSLALLPTISESGGNDGKKKAFKYVYTYVDKSGNESLPSNPSSIEAFSGWASGSYMSIGIPYEAKASEYRIYKMYAGSFGFIGSLLPENIGNSFIDDNITPDTTKGPPRDAEFFKDDGNYPSQVAFYQQRLVFAASYNEPQTVWMSRAGSFENFTKSIPIRDDDCIKHTIASNEVSMPLWMVTLRSLVLGTGSGVWEMASRSEVFTPTSLSATPQNYRGCASVRPVVVGSRILYVMKGGRQVYELAYSFGDDAYADNEVSVLSSHLFEGKKILSMVYQAAPYSMVWLVMSDGTLLSLTYMPEQRVRAWASHDTKGQFLDLCVLPGDGQQSLYAMVKRNNRYFLERMAYVFEDQDIEEAFFVDSGLSRDGDPTDHVSGLDHLEGQQVDILGDGVALPPQVVNDGTIYLDRTKEYQIGATYSTVHAGLGYEAELVTMPLEMTDGNSTTFGTVKRINKVDVLVDKSVGCKIGPGRDRLDSVAFRSDEDYDNPVAPQHINISKYLNTGWRERQQIHFVSDQPLPLTLLGIAPVFDINP